MIAAMSLFSRTEDEPGLYGTLRDCTSQGKGLKKFVAGDIAVINAADISRQEAQALVDAKPAAVINVEQFSTGLIPNYGPHMLLDSGVVLYEGFGTEFIRGFKDGKRGRITEDGQVFIGNKHIGAGVELDRERADKTFEKSQQALVDRMEAYFGNSVEFIHSEGPLLIDGLGIPESLIPIRDRKVVVVTPSSEHRAHVKLLRNFIREYEPVLIGVGSAADSLVELGYAPDCIIANPNDVKAETIRAAGQVLVPAETTGNAPGLDRIQDLGVGAMTFPAATESPVDLALLFADFHQADLIVQVGGSVDLDEVLTGTSHATPSALLSRMKAGTKIVDAEAVISLYTAPQKGATGWLLAILGVLVALAVIVLVAGLGGDGSFTQNLSSTWTNLVSTSTGWFK